MKMCVSTYCEDSEGWLGLLANTVLKHTLYRTIAQLYAV